MKLNPFDIDLEPQDIRTINTPDSPYRRIAPEDSKLSMSIPIVVKYDYLDLDKTSYHFRQQFHERDSQAYFEKMKLISSNTIDRLLRLSREDKSLHFFRSKLIGNVKTAINTLFSEKSVDPDLLIFHFALYNDKDVVADRKNDIRSPRVYFMLGNYGAIYPLFFDPYHELNPISG